MKLRNILMVLSCVCLGLISLSCPHIEIPEEYEKADKATQKRKVKVTPEKPAHKKKPANAKEVAAKVIGGIFKAATDSDRKDRYQEAFEKVLLKYLANNKLPKYISAETITKALVDSLEQVNKSCLTDFMNESNIGSMITSTISNNSNAEAAGRAAVAAFIFQGTDESKEAITNFFEALIAKNCFK